MLSMQVEFDDKYEYEIDIFNLKSKHTNYEKQLTEILRLLIDKHKYNIEMTNISIDKNKLIATICVEYDTNSSEYIAQQMALRRIEFYFNKHLKDKLFRKQIATFCNLKQPKTVCS